MASFNSTNLLSDAVKYYITRLNQSEDKKAFISSTLISCGELHCYFMCYGFPFTQDKSHFQEIKQFLENVSNLTELRDRIIDNLITIGAFDLDDLEDYLED